MKWEKTPLKPSIDYTNRKDTSLKIILKKPPTPAEIQLPEEEDSNTPTTTTQATKANPEEVEVNSKAKMKKIHTTYLGTTVSTNPANSTAHFRTSPAPEAITTTPAIKRETL